MLLLESYRMHTLPLSAQHAIYFFDVPAFLQLECAHIVKQKQGVLLTEWLAPDLQTEILQWYTLYLLPEVGLYCIQSTLAKNCPRLTDLSAVFPVSARLQTAIYELTRIPTRHFQPRRACLQHGHFPQGILTRAKSRASSQRYFMQFTHVAGKGVHEIPVGPIHAGIIEPGHFRFSVVGERILKLETQFGYTHKGMHALLREQPIEVAARLISRVSGDSTVAYATAFAMACEQAQHYAPALAVQLERALLIEQERLTNHLGDIGAIINDTGMPSLATSFVCLKETCLRHNAILSRHRYLMDAISPFTADSSISVEKIVHTRTFLAELENQLASLRTMVDAHHGLQDRLQNTGILTTQQAKHLGVLGVTAKASGLPYYDVRGYLSAEIYPAANLNPTPNTAYLGDVASRMYVRFNEISQSIQLIRHWLTQLESLNAAEITAAKQTCTYSGMGIGVVEGWRGPIIVIVQMQKNIIMTCHFHDPSWQNWPALEYAVLNNIVADFPLINKSFNLSYSGQDS